MSETTGTVRTWGESPGAFFGTFLRDSKALIARVPVRVEGASCRLVTIVPPRAPRRENLVTLDFVDEIERRTRLPLVAAARHKLGARRQRAVPSIAGVRAVASVAPGDAGVFPMVSQLPRRFLDQGCRLIGPALLLPNVCEIVDRGQRARMIFSENLAACLVKVIVTRVWVVALLKKSIGLSR